MAIRKYGSGEIIETTQVPDRRADEEREEQEPKKDEDEEQNSRD